MRIFHNGNPIKREPGCEDESPNRVHCVFLQAISLAGKVPDTRRIPEIQVSVVVDQSSHHNYISSDFLRDVGFLPEDISKLSCLNEHGAIEIDLEWRLTRQNPFPVLKTRHRLASHWPISNSNEGILFCKDIDWAWKLHDHIASFGSTVFGTTNTSQGIESTRQLERQQIQGAPRDGNVCCQCCDSQDRPSNLEGPIASCPGYALYRRHLYRDPQVQAPEHSCCAGLNPTQQHHHHHHHRHGHCTYWQTTEAVDSTKARVFDERTLESLRDQAGEHFRKTGDTSEIRRATRFAQQIPEGKVRNQLDWHYCSHNHNHGLHHLHYHHLKQQQQQQLHQRAISKTTQNKTWSPRLRQQGRLVKLQNGRRYYGGRLW